MIMANPFLRSSVDNMGQGILADSVGEYERLVLLLRRFTDSAQILRLRDQLHYALGELQREVDRRCEVESR